jgi:hypothetical protein
VETKQALPRVSEEVVHIRKNFLRKILRKNASKKEYIMKRNSWLKTLPSDEYRRTKHLILNPAIADMTILLIFIFFISLLCSSLRRR